MGQSINIQRSRSFFFYFNENLFHVAKFVLTNNFIYLFAKNRESNEKSFTTHFSSSKTSTTTVPFPSYSK
jgi:hypothetical protein